MPFPFNDSKMNPAFNGTWVMDNSKTVNFDEYGKYVGFDDATIETLRNDVITIVMSGDGGVFRLESNASGQPLNWVANFGELIEFLEGTGNKTTLMVTLDGTDPVEDYEIPAKNKKWTIKRTINGDVMTAITTAGDITVTQIFNRK